MQVQSLGQEDPLEEEMATHSTILAWRIPWTEEPGAPQSMELKRGRHDTEQLTPVQLLVTPWTVAHQAPLSMEFSRQEHWSGLPFPSPEDLSDSGDRGSIPGSGRSPAGGNGNPLQYPCLENPMDRGAWWATVRNVPQSWT